MDNFIHASWNDQNVNTTLHVHFSKSCKAIKYKASSHYIYMYVYILNIYINPLPIIMMLLVCI